ncbi:peptidoglycan synthetase [Malaciobacter molluscorum]|uniref:peptidoglycan synthetase n=1 Tax=Malaciobacter molluscorum TaxID=1032072 RepID=UPI00100BAB65|nr:peptidoglycan synthetase [Malaciobacter molluscorum]RXJ93936.1 peptidoglycan synthetase [Malaciobacter molluscorum]
MKISSIIDIMDGEVLNSPSISFIYNIKQCASKVKEGDLFVAKNLNDIQIAINNGAFAILVDSYVSVTDFEIAWIKVGNLDEAIIKFIRFKLSNYDLNVFNCDEITFNYIKYLKPLNKIDLKLIETIDDILKILDDIEINNILIFKDKHFMNKLYPQNHLIEQIDSNKLKNIVKHTMFETSFTYNNIFFQKIKVPELYITNFLMAYDFLDCELDFSKLKNCELLRPIFVDRFINQVEFGKSNKFLILQNNLSLIEKEILYLKQNFKYGKIIFLCKEEINNFYAKQNIIEKEENLKDFLKSSNFNAAYLIGYKYEKLNELLNSEDIQTTLLF